MVDRSKLGQFWLSDGFTAVAEKPVTFCKDIWKVDQKVMLRVGAAQIWQSTKKSNFNSIKNISRMAVYIRNLKTTLKWLPTSGRFLLQCVQKHYYPCFCLSYRFSQNKHFQAMWTNQGPERVLYFQRIWKEFKAFISLLEIIKSSQDPVSKYFFTGKS